MPVRRSAFTLRELVLVLIIFAVVVGLIAPAVYSTRQAANRLHCLNNLRYVGQGLNSHTNLKGYFPSAYTGQGDVPSWGWGATLLPFLGEETLYFEAGVATRPFGEGTNPAQPNLFTQSELPSFRCPSDQGASINSSRLRHGLANYKAVGGQLIGLGPSPTDPGGVMFENSRIRPDQITDGASNTLIVAEFMYDEPSQNTAGLWSGMTGNGRNPDNGVPFDDVMYLGPSEINSKWVGSFSSRHGNGACFAFCDGSARFLQEKIDSLTLRALMGRCDGTQVDLSGY